jgi:nucleotide-binding universal stress UspA family protein
MSSAPVSPGPGSHPESNVVVGYEGEPTGRDVLAFAEHWARAGGDQITVVTVYDGGASPGIQRVDAEWVAYGREQADTLLAEARTLVDEGLKPRFLRVPSSSAAHGLHDILEDTEQDTPLVVLGSRRTRGLRRTYPGSTAERLLDGSPVPVAVVPWGYTDTEVAPFRKVAAAFIDTPDGHVALQHAARIAGHLGAELEVLSVVPDTRVIPSLGDVGRFGQDQRRSFQESLDAALSQLPPDVAATGRLLDGPVVDALADVRPGEADLLVIGSRGYGPVRRVLLGGVSARVVRHARIPVVVVPRG